MPKKVTAYITLTNQSFESQWYRFSRHVLGYLLNLNKKSQKSSFSLISVFNCE